MTLKELNQKYSVKDLQSMPGDAQLRKKLFTPMLTDLYENKIIYYEAFLCVAILENIEITDKGFFATAIPYLEIKKGCAITRPYFPDKPWKFGTDWRHMSLSDNHICTYGLWSIWTEKELVKTIEELVKNGDREKAMDLTIGP